MHRHAFAMVAVMVVAASAASVAAVTAGRQSGARELTVTPSAAAVVDGRIVVDGKPFFPVLEFEQCEPDAMERGRELGANVFLGGCPDVSPERQLAMVPEGAHAVVPVDDATGGGSAVGDPALLGLTYPDEPENNGWSSDRLATAYPFRRGGSNSTLTFLTTGAGFFSRSFSAPNPPRSEYRALTLLADVPGFDLYPLGHCSADLSAVYDAQREFVQLAAGAPTFQWIETGPIRPEYCGGFAMTPGELRAEVWLAVVGGARGIGYFTHTWSPEHSEFDVSPPLQAEMTRTNRMVQALSGGLTGEAAIAATDSAAIKVIARRAAGGGRTYVFAVNASRDHVRAQLAVPALADGAASVWGERRSIPVAAGRLSDDFAPLAVHVYVQPAQR